MNKTRYFRISYEDYVFFASLNKDHEFEMGNLNSKDGSCVQIDVHHSKRKADLGGVMFNRNCPANKELARKEGTVSLVRCALKVILLLYPSITHYTLTDKSWFECRNRNVHLCNHNFLLYGKTWYQRHFEATNRSGLTERTMKRFDRVLSKKPTERFSVFWGRFDKLIRNSSCYKDIRDRLGTIRQMYETCDDWHDFFRNVHEQVGCFFFVPMLKHLFSYFSYGTFYGEKWFISAMAVDGWTLDGLKIKEIKQLPAQIGGRRPEVKKEKSKRRKQLIVFE